MGSGEYYISESGEIMIQVRLAQISDAPELRKLNDLFNGEDSATAEIIKKSFVLLSKSMQISSLVFAAGR